MHGVIKKKTLDNALGHLIEDFKLCMGSFNRKHKIMHGVIL